MNNTIITFAPVVWKKENQSFSSSRTTLPNRYYVSVLNYLLFNYIILSKIISNCQIEKVIHDI